MIVYLDASALVKKYIAETGSREVADLIAQANIAGTSLISRAEVSAALAKAVRTGALHRDEAARALRLFLQQLPDFQRTHLTESLVVRADSLAWEQGLRGYDAVHLASALFWQESLGEPITLATFDAQLWQAGQPVGLSVWPEDLERFAR